MRTGELSGIHVEPGDDTVVVRLQGDIDAALRDDASVAMAAALVDGRPVVVDASDATFVDSSGVAFVLQLHLAASEAGIPVTVLDPGQVLARVLEMLHLSAVIPDHTDARSMPPDVPVTVS